MIFTHKQFVIAIWNGYLASTPEAKIVTPGDGDILSYGWDAGWLEEQDVLWADRLIERRNAARIVHEFLRIELKEQDERNIRKANVLTDLYDCKVCANHIAQVYLKGIMPSKEPTRFQLLMKIDENEMQDIVCKMFEMTPRDGVTMSK